MASPRKRLGGEGQVHHQGLEVGAGAERVEGRLDPESRSRCGSPWQRPGPAIPSPWRPPPLLRPPRPPIRPARPAPRVPRDSRPSRSRTAPKTTAVAALRTTPAPAGHRRPRRRGRRDRGASARAAASRRPGHSGAPCSSDPPGPTVPPGRSPVHSCPWPRPPGPASGPRRRGG